MVQVEGVGLCMLGVSSNPNPKTRIAGLSKLGKYFDYGKVVVIDPPYTERQAKHAKVGVGRSWYFVKEKQALMDLLHINYDDLDDRGRAAIDKMIKPPPPPPPVQAPPPPNMMGDPGHIIIQGDGGMIVMRNPAPHVRASEAEVAEFARLIERLESNSGGQQVRRRAPKPTREAQPDTKKAKAISLEDMECLCCAENQKDTILNCGHLEMCGECAGKVQSCPSCSVPITERKHVWL